MSTTMEDLQNRYAEELERLRCQLAEFLALHNLVDQATDTIATVHQFLESSAADRMDETLVKYVILYESTPQGLARFASQGPHEEALIHQLLFDDDDDDKNAMVSVRKEWLLADGAKVIPNNKNKKSCPPTAAAAQYGPAMNIYTTILESSEHAQEAVPTNGILHRLAMAIALEHSVPVVQRNPEQCSEPMDRLVDPVRRYLNYELAYQEGALDPCFETLTTWELRFVVNGEEPDEISAWGRQMLCDYRPDHVLTSNYNASKYVGMVRSNIRYGSQDVQHDRPELQFFQNILMNGGVCGRRAFFGRFLLRAFGIPTTARPSPGHGALMHWTPDQFWVVCLGPRLGHGTTHTRYIKDLDFLATAKARTHRDAYWKKVKRAQWYGDVCGEIRIYGEHEQKSPQFWYGVSLQMQKEIIEELHNAKEPSAPQCHSRGDRTLTLVEKATNTPISPEAKTIRYEHNGVIVIPAAAYQNPRQTKDVSIMTSLVDGGGGLQIYLPAFQPQGLTIMRGGTFKMDSNGCSSGSRIKSGGYGKYHDWGFRVAISGSDSGDVDTSCPKSHVTIDIGSAMKSNVPIEFVYIQPGTFVMGGESQKDGRFECVEVPKHQVTLTKGFYLGKYPVTQAQYQAVMGSNPSKSTKSPDCPVDNIGEKDATDFCDKLVETIGQDFRLPTEAEWEYACRAGQGDHQWFFGEDPSRLGEYAWFQDNSGGKSHPVGQKKPNPFGLYDMYGNVFERVADKYAKDYYATSPSVDPTGPSQGTKSSFEYKLNIPNDQKYSLVADVVTANDKQHLNVATTNAKNDSTGANVVMPLPFTNGVWQKSSSSLGTVVISLQQGENTLRIWRDSPPQYGVAIKAFTLEPLF